MKKFKVRFDVMYQIQCRFIPVERCNCKEKSNVTFVYPDECFYCKTKFPRKLVEKKAKLETILRRLGVLKEIYC